jgi:hypothetical protein
MRQHSAARPRSGYFGVTLILNHLIGPSERRRIECCLRPIRARLRPVRTNLLRNVSRARDMGPLPSRGARSAPQPRLCGVMVRYAENGFISICENATCAWTAVSACQRNGSPPQLRAMQATSCTAIPYAQMDRTANRGPPKGALNELYIPCFGSAEHR